MRKKLVFMLVVLLAIGAQQAFAQMSDDQIITFISENVAAGKSERQIAAELMAKGVTTSQLQRLMKAYKSGNTGMSEVPEVSTRQDGKRTGRKPVNLDDEEDESTTTMSKSKDGKETADKKTTTKKKSKKKKTKGKAQKVVIDPVTRCLWRMKMRKKRTRT